MSRLTPLSLARTLLTPSTRSLPSKARISTTPSLSEVPKPIGFVQSLLHGSAEAKAQESQQHSKVVGRGKYVHELIKHRVHPSKIVEYTEAAEKVFGSLKVNADGSGCQLMGSWQTAVGELDTFVHIIRHPSLIALTSTLHSRLLPSTTNAFPPSSTTALAPFLVTRESSLLQEFAAWPAKDNPELSQQVEDRKRTGDGVFELRTYELIPGTMLEWEGAWRKGIEARRKIITPEGAWFTQVGHLHTVHHLWAYSDMEDRKAIREKAWTLSGWSDTVKQTVKLAKGMTSQIMVPMSWSPLK
ncbi:hypothetical protein BDY24DRAFT_346949 [Mrakia frigida]|uniref:NIPSNAP family protein n=1 Tax=Mrakia frigida TaxID=29902 RepID=UPI003FCBF6A9